MLADKIQYYSKQHKSFLAVLEFILVIGVGWVDYIIGPDYSMLLLYLIPVLTTAWFVGKWAAIAISVESLIVLLIVDLVWKNKSAESLAIYWNDLSNLVFFLIVTYIIASLKSAFEYKKLMADIDSLTGVANRGRFYDLAAAEINRLLRYGHPFTVCYIDIDNFKRINDTFGHGEGDILLRQIAESIKNNMRRTDVVGRLGGDEFALLMPETAADVALSVAGKVHKLQDIVRKKGLTITLSIGMVVYLKPPENIEEMIQRADALMYSVKTDGKNNIKYEIVGQE
ncbi:MAG: diguanylate cyclase [Desulfobacteraceae bacterium]|nr:MAG: diguanylate cyclase [Desulfobacteraceae bacterium]